MDQQNDYQFVMIPQQLASCLDANCSKMLTTLLGLSSILSNEDGWFYRSNKDLQLDTRMSENLIRATLDTLYRAGIINVDCIGKGRGHRTNRIHINFESFKVYQQYSFNDIRNNPDLWIDTVKYKDHFVPSYMRKCEEICEGLCERICEKVSTNTDTPDTSNTTENILYNKEETCEKVSTQQSLPTCTIDTVEQERLLKDFEKDDLRESESSYVNSQKLPINEDMRLKGYECCKTFMDTYSKLDYQQLLVNPTDFLTKYDIKLGSLSQSISSSTGVFFSKNSSTQLLKDYVQLQVNSKGK